MKRTINVKVKGNHLTKDSNKAGTRGEGNVTTLCITFGDDWETFVKSILFWDAHGMNPIRYTLTPDWQRSEKNVYLVEIPPSALGLAGNMTFRIDGYAETGTDPENSKRVRQRSISATLEVDDALIENDLEIITPTDIEKLLSQEERIGDVIENALSSIAYTMEIAGAYNTRANELAEGLEKAKTAAETAASNAGTAQKAAGEAQTAAETAKKDASDFADNAEKAKIDAETARDEAIGYAENFESLAEAVSRATTSATFAEAQTELIGGYKNQILDAKDGLEEALKDAEEFSENIKVAKSDIELAMQSVSTSSYWASVSSASAEEAKNEAVDARDEAVKARKAAQTAQTASETAKKDAEDKASDALESATNAATSEANSKTYADNAENAVSQSRYIGANGNWYVWDDSRKTFVDSGETAHAGSTVYVGSNPPSNAQVWIDPNGDGDISKSIREIYDTFKSIKPIRKVKITLLASAWVEEDTEEYSQVVSIKNTTANSQVDLQITKEQIAIFREKDISFWAENKNGIITVFCLGQKPTNDYTVQATITEVVLDE